LVEGRLGGRGGHVRGEREVLHGWQWFEEVWWRSQRAEEVLLLFGFLFGYFVKHASEPSFEHLHRAHTGGQSLAQRSDLVFSRSQKVLVAAFEPGELHGEEGPLLRIVLGFPGRETGGHPGLVTTQQGHVGVHGGHDRVGSGGDACGSGGMRG
jgi:hypothetical protein